LQQRPRTSSAHTCTSTSSLVDIAAYVVFFDSFLALILRRFAVIKLGIVPMKSTQLGPTVTCPCSRLLTPRLVGRTCGDIKDTRKFFTLLSDIITRDLQHHCCISCRRWTRATRSVSADIFSYALTSLRKFSEVCRNVFRKVFEKLRRSSFSLLVPNFFPSRFCHFPKFFMRSS